MRREARPVELVAIKICIIGETVVGIVVGIRGVPLKHDLIFSVAVHVADGGVVGVIIVFLAERFDTEPRTLQGDIDVSQGGVGREGVASGRSIALLAGAHLIRGCLRAAIVVFEEGRSGQRLGVDLLSVAIDVECLVFRVGGEIAPGDRHLLRILPDGHDPAAQFLTLHLREIIVRLRRNAKGDRCSREKA